jgi:hypothetical protein
MSLEPHYLRGAFAVYPPRGQLQEPPQFIPFRFNPENLTRSFAAEKGTGDAGQVKLADTSGEPNTGGKQLPDSMSGSFTESFTLKLRFDFDDRHASMKLLPPALGIAPEIAALELLLHTAGALQEKVPGAKATRPALPKVLFIWGRMRVLPVRIASLTIDETVFNAELNPTRAEAQVGLEVLPLTDTSDPLVRAAHQYTQGKRQLLGRLFHATSAAQGAGVILPL